MSDSLEMQIQTETEDQATQDNAPPIPSDTTRHPMAYPDTELDVDFEHCYIPGLGRWNTHRSVARLDRRQRTRISNILS